jgi:DNA repair protein RecO (recombination protein O)
MTEQRVLMQPAYVLHQRAYRDTSALIELFTPEHGRLGVVAKGVRGAKSRWRGVVQIFQPLLVSWSQRGELGTLIAAEAQGAALSPAPAFIASGFYLNEILMRLLIRHDPQLELFGWYDAALRSIAEISPADVEANLALEIILRGFELQLLATLGYGLVLDHEVERGAPVRADQRYHYHIDHGPVLAGESQDSETALSIGGSSLLALQAGDLSDDTTRREAKRLLRAVLARHLGNKPLHSRELMQSAVHKHQTAAEPSGENSNNA